MSEWDAQKMLDLYIHDYMIKKGMHSAAQTFVEEANLNCDKDVVINPPEGFLKEWWSLFWDVYSTKPENNTNATEGSSSMAAENATQDVHLNMPMPMPKPNTNFGLPNVGPIVARSRPSYFTPIIGDTNVLRPVIDSYPHHNAPIISPMQEINLNRSGKALISDKKNCQAESFTEFVAARSREQERLKLSARKVRSSSRNYDVDQLARMLPAIGTSSNPLMKVNNNLLPPVIRKDELGSGMRPMDAEPSDGQNVIQTMKEPRATGISTSSTSLSSDSDSIS